MNSRIGTCRAKQRKTDDDHIKIGSCVAVLGQLGAGVCWVSAGWPVRYRPGWRHHNAAGGRDRRRGHWRGDWPCAMAGTAAAPGPDTLVDRGDLRRNGCGASVGDRAAWYRHRWYRPAAAWPAD